MSSVAEWLNRGLSWRWRALRNRLPQGWLRLVPNSLVYDGAFFDACESPATQSAPIIADTLVAAFAPASCLDVGCGSGALLAAFSERGVTHVQGLEYSDSGILRCRSRGLPVTKFNLEGAREFHPDRPIDLVTSFEVAEHLAERSADRFVRTLTAAGAPIVMTAAHPGQGGHAHLNEQPKEYWIEKLDRRGFDHDSMLAAALAQSWMTRGATSWYWQNVMVFRPGSRSR